MQRVCRRVFHASVHPCSGLLSLGSLCFRSALGRGLGCFGKSAQVNPGALFVCEPSYLRWVPARSLAQTWRGFPLIIVPSPGIPGSNTKANTPRDWPVSHICLYHSITATGAPITTTNFALVITLSLVQCPYISALSLVRQPPRILRPDMPRSAEIPGVWVHGFIPRFSLQL